MKKTKDKKLIDLARRYNYTIKKIKEEKDKEIKKLKEGIITAVDKTAKSKDEDIKLLKKQSKINYEDVLDYKKSLQKLEKEKETEMLNLEKCHNQLSKVREEILEKVLKIINNPMKNKSSEELTNYYFKIKSKIKELK